MPIQPSHLHRLHDVVQRLDASFTVATHVSSASGKHVNRDTQGKGLGVAYHLVLVWLLLCPSVNKRSHDSWKAIYVVIQLGYIAHSRVI